MENGEIDMESRVKKKEDTLVDVSLLLEPRTSIVIPHPPVDNAELSLLATSPMLLRIYRLAEELTKEKGEFTVEDLKNKIKEKEGREVHEIVCKWYLYTLHRKGLLYKHTRGKQTYFKAKNE